MDEKDSYDDVEILENLKKILYEEITANKKPAKVGDLLKVIDMRRKISAEGKGEKKFWEMVDRIRTEELTRAASKKPVRKRVKK